MYLDILFLYLDNVSLNNVISFVGCSEIRKATAIRNSLSRSQKREIGGNDLGGGG